MKVKWQLLWKKFNKWHNSGHTHRRPYGYAWPAQARKIRSLVMEQLEISATWNWSKIWREMNQWWNERAHLCPTWESQQRKIRELVNKEIKNVTKTNCH